jgi:hypothetical protein
MGYVMGVFMVPRSLLNRVCLLLYAKMKPAWITTAEFFQFWLRYDDLDETNLGMVTIRHEKKLASGRD